jgi:hypothetical protein
MLITAIGGTHATRISTFLLNEIPTGIEEFYESTTYQVILRLSHTLQSLPFTSDGKPDGLDGHLKHEEMALAALNDLHKLLQGNFFKGDIVTKTKKRRPQQSRPSELSTDLEDVVQRFKSLGLRFPKTRVSADETIQKIMETQRRTLEVIRHRHSPHVL